MISVPIPTGDYVDSQVRYTDGSFGGPTYSVDNGVLQITGISATNAAIGNLKIDSVFMHSSRTLDVGQLLVVDVTVSNGLNWSKVGLALSDSFDPVDAVSGTNNQTYGNMDQITVRAYSSGEIDVVEFSDSAQIQNTLENTADNSVYSLWIERVSTDVFTCGWFDGDNVRYTAGQTFDTGHFGTSDLYIGIATRVEDTTEYIATVDNLRIYSGTVEVTPFEIAHGAFNGAAFEITASGLTVGADYQLLRTESLGSAFSVVGSPVTASDTTGTFIDPAPPAGHAFYKIVAP